MNHEDFKKAIDLSPNTKFKFDLDKVDYSFMTYPNVTGIVTFVAWLGDGYFLGAVEGYFDGLSFKPEEVELYKEVEDEGWIKWGGSSEAPVPEGTKVDVKYHDGSVAIGIGSQDNSTVDGCDYTCSSWYCNVESPSVCSIVAYRIHKPSVASQEAITERLEGSPSVDIDLAEEGSEKTVEALVSITQEVKYTVVIKGTTFTFTQDELDALAEELLGFTTL